MHLIGTSLQNLATEDVSALQTCQRCTSKFLYLFLSLFFRRLLGIITKKDILRHMAQMANQDPESIMFNQHPPLPATRKMRVKRRSVYWTTHPSDHTPLRYPERPKYKTKNTTPDGTPPLDTCTRLQNESFEEEPGCLKILRVLGEA